MRSCKESLESLLTDAEEGFYNGFTEISESMLRWRWVVCLRDDDEKLLRRF